MLIVELKSDALKERHWRQLCRALKVDWSLSELTLGQVWDADLLHNEHTVKDVVSVAQGEMALEEFLKQVRNNEKEYAFRSFKGPPYLKQFYRGIYRLPLYIRFESHGRVMSWTSSTTRTSARSSVAGMTFSTRSKNTSTAWLLWNCRRIIR